LIRGHGRDSADALAVGGATGFSSCDWPGELVATVFCQGCPWNCGYCHNPHLRAAEDGRLTWREVLGFLQTRAGLLDGVVFSGGEPTLQAALPAAIREVRALGFRIGLHTAGPYPDRLAPVLGLVDWIGFDAKAPFGRYEAITGVPGSGSRARDSLRLVIASGVACEVRTTLHSALLDAAAMTMLADELAAMGITNYAVQAFRPRGCRRGFVDAHGSPSPVVPADLGRRFGRFTIRGMP
jgi:pyruvate formate lyase activating enzyme